MFDGGGILFSDGWNCAAYMAVQGIHRIARSKKYFYVIGSC